MRRSDLALASRRAAPASSRRASDAAKGHLGRQHRDRIEHQAEHDRRARQAAHPTAVAGKVRPGQGHDVRRQQDRGRESHAQRSLAPAGAPGQIAPSGTPTGGGDRGRAQAKGSRGDEQAALPGVQQQGESPSTSASCGDEHVE